MIAGLCEFAHLAARPSGPDVWVELGEELDRISCSTTCQHLKQKLGAVACDTVERHGEAIECHGRPITRGDVDNAANRAYQSMLDAMVCLVAARDIDPILRKSLLTQAAIIAADLRGEWMCLV